MDARHQYRNSLSFASCTTQSRPSNRFSPVMALQGKIVHLWVVMSSSRRPCTYSHPISTRPISRRQRRPSVGTGSPLIFSCPATAGPPTPQPRQRGRRDRGVSIDRIPLGSPEGPYIRSRRSCWRRRASWHRVVSAAKRWSAKAPSTRRGGHTPLAEASRRALRHNSRDGNGR